MKKDVMKILKACLVLVLALGLVLPVWADESCENEDNDAISAEFALCSTHAYNIGMTENPKSTDAANKELMQNVVALKSTIITQQMYRHYEQMESMLSRFKTQLKKAVLTTNLQVAGASKDEDSGSSSYSSDKSVYMSAGVSNCQNKYSDAEILKCYQDNMNSIVNQSGNGSKPTREIKKQLVNDVGNFRTIQFESGVNNVCESVSTDLGKCKDNMSNSEFRECLNAARTCLQNQQRSYERAQRTPTSTWGAK